MAENEDDLPPTNAQVLTRFRRELLQHEVALTRVRDELLRIGEGQSPEGPAADKAWTALACTCLDEHYPPRPEIADRTSRLVEQDRKRLRKVVPFALAAMEDELAIAISARRCLAFMDAIAEPIPERLHNYPVEELKRALNAHGFALARRIPGWKD